jgi:hypothetical protein
LPCNGFHERQQRPRPRHIETAILQLAHASALSRQQVFRPGEPPES